MEDPKIIVGWSTKQVVVIGDRDEDYREVEWEFLFGVAALVDLPFLARDAEAADRRASELEPETALV